MEQMEQEQIRGEGMICKLQIGQAVNLTGRLFCKWCGAVMSQGGIDAHFAGHDHGFDVFNFNKALRCPWCSTINEAAERPCDGEPRVCIGTFSDVEQEKQK